MSTRGRAILIVAFFAGLVGLWWLDYARVPDRDAAKISEARVLAGLWDARPDDVHRLEIDGGPKRLAFERRPGGRWQMVEPLDVAADPSLVETLALNLKMLERVRDAGTLNESPASYGLEPPSRTIRVYGRGASRPLATLEVGSPAATRDRRYVRSAGSGGIEVVDARAVAPAELPAESWRDRMLVRMPTFQVQALTASRGDVRLLRFEREGDLWKIADPFRAIADEGRVDGILAEVAGLRVPDGGFVADDVKDFAPFGLDQPSVTLALTPRGSGDPQTIHLGKPAPAVAGARGVRYYARRHDQDDVVVVDAGLLKDVGTNPADFHGKKLTDVHPDRVDAIRLTSEGAAVVVARRSKGWERIAPLKDRADASAVETLLKKLDAAQASLLFEPTKAPDPQTDKPWAVLDLWEGSGPRPGEGPESAPEKAPRFRLKLGRRDPAAKTVFAAVEGDPLVFALPSSFLDGMTFGPLAFRDLQVASVRPAQIEKLTIIRGSKDVDKAVVLAAPRDGDPRRWRLEVPVEAPADAETVGRALLTLANLRAETLVSDRPESDEKYGLDKPPLVVKWKLRDALLPPPRETIKGEEVTLFVGSEAPGGKKPRYARLSNGPIVFTLAAEVVALLEAEWRERSVFALDPRSTERVTFRWPSLTLNARPVADAKGSDPEWTLADPPRGLKFDAAQIKPLVQTLAHLSTFRFAQHTGPIPPETGLFPARLEVEAQPAGPTPPRILRVGRMTPDGYIYATTEPGPKGAVFLLPLSNWAPWLRVPPIEAPAAKAEAPAAKAEAPAAKEAKPK